MITPRRLTHLLSLFLLFWSLQAAATSVLPISLERMAAVAEVIFHGKVISNEVKIDPVSGRVATFTRFEIIEAIKGDPGPSQTIKQIGGQLPGSKVRQIIHGVPQFRTDQEYVVFLPKPSNLGFASPIGLSQGKFHIRKINGISTVDNRNGRPSRINTPAQQRSLAAPGAATVNSTPDSVTRDNNVPTISLSDFINTVREIINQ